MRRRWQRVAERAANAAYNAEDVGAALVPALEQDCREELRPGFMAKLRQMGEKPVLFKEVVAGEIAVLRSEAAAGLERAVLDNLACLSETEMAGFALLKGAVAGALQTALNQRSRQVEEHYAREDSRPRAANVRGRLEEAGNCADLAAIAERVLGISPDKVPAKLRRKTGLDDGVQL